MQPLQKLLAFCCNQRHVRNWKCNCLQFLHISFWACYTSYYFVSCNFPAAHFIRFGIEHILCAKIFFCEIWLKDFKQGKKYSVQGRFIGLVHMKANKFCSGGNVSDQVKLLSLQKRFIYLDQQYNRIISNKSCQTNHKCAWARRPPLWFSNNKGESKFCVREFAPWEVILQCLTNFRERNCKKHFEFGWNCK